jgi:MFS family permease
MAVEPRQGGGGGVVHGMKVDLRQLHEYWMAMLFPRQRSGGHSVLGRWTPSTTAGKIKYRLWSAIGAICLGILYPLMLTGVMVRFYSRRINIMVASIGAFGVVFLAALAWGALTLLARYQFDFSQEGVAAVGAAAVVATAAAGLAALFTKVGGRGTTVLLAYPAAMTAIFLPPVVVALFSPYLNQVLFPQSESIAIWILDNVLTVGNVNELLRDRFELAGVGYVLMWFAIAVPVGWLLGFMVTLADLIRPKE